MDPERISYKAKLQKGNDKGCHDGGQKRGEKHAKTKISAESPPKMLVSILEKPLKVEMII